MKDFTSERKEEQWWNWISKWKYKPSLNRFGSTFWILAPLRNGIPTSSPARSLKKLTIKSDRCMKL